jgi:plastocyanin
MPTGRKRLMKNRSARAAVAAVAVSASAAVFAAVALAHAAASGSTLVGTVGKNDAYKITLADGSGKSVKTLKPGTYKLVIHDDSSFHNYELDGPHGKSWKFTSVPFKGTKTFTLKLAAGKYKAYCAPHEPVMFQHFTVSG